MGSEGCFFVCLHCCFVVVSSDFFVRFFCDFLGFVYGGFFARVLVMDSEVLQGFLCFGVQKGGILKDGCLFWLEFCGGTEFW